MNKSAAPLRARPTEALAGPNRARCQTTELGPGETDQTVNGVLLSRKSSWQAGASRLMKLKPRVGRQSRLLAAGSPGLKPCSMLLFPAPSRPRTRTWRFPRSSSSCR